MNIWKLLVLLIVIVVGKVIYNLYYLIITNIYYEEYKKFIKESGSWYIKEHRQSIVNLFKKSGIEDTEIPQTELAGYGFVRHGKFSVFRNLSVIREDIVAIVNGFFHESMGIYRQRAVEALNPIYWVETIFQIPTLTLKYFGFKKDNLIVKFIQLIWSVVVVISTVVGIIFNKEFIDWISKNIKL